MDWMERKGYLRCEEVSESSYPHGAAESGHGGEIGYRGERGGEQ